MPARLEQTDPKPHPAALAIWRTQTFFAAVLAFVGVLFVTESIGTGSQLAVDLGMVAVFVGLAWVIYSGVGIICWSR